MIDFLNMQRDRTLNSKHIKEFFKDINLKEFRKKRVLEIGCGNGKTALALQKNYKTETYCVDINHITHKQVLANLKVVQKDAMQLKLSDFGGMRFDFIYSFRVFMYLNYKEKLRLLELIYNELLVIGGTALIDFAGDSINPESPSREDGKFFYLYASQKLHTKGIEVIVDKNYHFDKKLALDSAETPEEINIINKGMLDNQTQFKSFTIKVIKNSNEPLKLN